MVVGLPLRCKRLTLLCALALSVLKAQADGFQTSELSTQAYVAQIQVNTTDEVSTILMRLDDLLKGEGSFDSSEPLALVLHGDEAKAFLPQNYSENKALVDLAARLDAFNAVDVQICETWLRGQSVSPSELPAFVDTIPYGPLHEASLIQKGYQFF